MGVNELRTRPAGRDGDHHHRQPGRADLRADAHGQRRPPARPDQPGDTVVLSASPIPGNEALVYRTVDNLFRLGARVLYNRIANIHVRGHAAQEELKIIQALVQPKYFVPIHGEYRHLVLHAQLAREHGRRRRERLRPRRRRRAGDRRRDGAEIGERVPADYVYVDGLGVGDVDHVVLRDRQHLATDGMVVVILAVDKQTGKLVGRPDVVSRGVTSIEESEDLLERTRDAVVASLAGRRPHRRVVGR